jgi:hypothetical protein
MSPCFLSGEHQTTHAGSIYGSRFCHPVQDFVPATPQLTIPVSLLGHLCSWQLSGTVLDEYQPFPSQTHCPQPCHLPKPLHRAAALHWDGAPGSTQSPVPALSPSSLDSSESRTERLQPHNPGEEMRSNHGYSWRKNERGFMFCKANPEAKAWDKHSWSQESQLQRTSD